MDYDKLIERLRKEAYGSDIEDLLLGASTAIETLWADLARVTAERDAYKTYFNDLSSKPYCNTCENKDCEYKPRVGDTVRANCPLYSGPEADRLRAENEQLRGRVRQLETRARTERCDAADYDCRELGTLRREVAELRERLAADGWIDPAVALPPNDDMVLAIVSGKPADNIILEDAYELASYGSEVWIVEQFELWETPTVTWWRPLPDPPRGIDHENP